MTKDLDLDLDFHKLWKYPAVARTVASEPIPQNASNVAGDRCSYLRLDTQRRGAVVEQRRHTKHDVSDETINLNGLLLLCRPCLCHIVQVLPFVAIHRLSFSAFVVADRPLDHL